MSIFINIDGVNGGCQEMSHTGWIVADKMALGINKDVSFEDHSTASAKISKPQNSVISITKKMCPASPSLKQMATNKTPFAFKMDLTKSMSESLGGHNVGGDSVYAHFEYPKGHITKYHLEVTSSGEAIEKIFISYTSYTMKYVSTDNLGSSASNTSAGYDFIHHTKG